MIEHGIDKVERQPVVQSAAFIDPASDTSPGGPAEGFVMAVFCDAPPSDGDGAVFVAANNRFELRPSSGGTTGTPVTVSDGMGDFAILFTEDGEVVYA